MAGQTRRAAACAADGAGAAQPAATTRQRPRARGTRAARRERGSLLLRAVPLARCGSSSASGILASRPRRGAGRRRRWSLYYYARAAAGRAPCVDGRARGSVTLLDRDGEVFAWRGDQFGGRSTADSPSPRSCATPSSPPRTAASGAISASTRMGIAGAIRINLAEGRGPLSGNGGSTDHPADRQAPLPRQPLRPRRWDDEAAYEADCRAHDHRRARSRRRSTRWPWSSRYSKDEILTIYLNRAYLGAGTRGFEAAAQRYFGKSAADVTPAEAAMLAGLLVAPSPFAPTADLERSQGRANVVVGLMRDAGLPRPPRRPPRRGATRRSSRRRRRRGPAAPSPTG